MLAEMPDTQKESANRAILRPVEPRILEGPTVEYVEAFCGEAAGRRWVCDHAWPGCRVVEGPLQTGPSQVAVAVEPGARVVICGTRTPWRVCDYTPEVAACAAVSAVLTDELGQAAAQTAEERAGYLVNEHGERILSVRLQDKCERKEEMWERKPCGHVWCKMCNGHEG